MNFEKISACVFVVYKRCNVKTFPIDCFDIVTQYGFKIKKYCELPDSKKAACKRLSRDACTIDDTIYYESNNILPRIRFSIMHELGHILLNTDHEDEADCFASYSLAPRCAIKNLDCQNAEDVHTTFLLSYAAANRAWADYRLLLWMAYDKDLKNWLFPPEPKPKPELMTERRATEKPRNKNSKKRREIEEKIAFLEEYDPDYFFRAGEYSRLYGNDL